MTKPLKTFTLLSIAAILLLGSCSSKFGSREEAKNAAINYERESKEVIVSTLPSLDEVRRETKKRQTELARECRKQEQKLNASQPTDEIAIAYYNLDNAEWKAKCLPSPEDEFSLELEDIDELTKVERKQPIVCNEEKETNQFVCKKWRTNKEEMNGGDWLWMKPNYSYFRY